jgi:predicted nucleic acid-binding protein
LKVLVDTCVWSQLLRKATDDSDLIVSELRELIQEFQVQMIGPIRQELLSGIKNKNQFTVLKEQLRSFLDLEIITEDYETAAQMSNACRRKGVQGSHTDFLICAVANRYDLAIFTTDGDFDLYRRHIPVKLYKPGKRA